MLLDGRAIANQILDELKVAIAKTGGRPPGLTVILVGENPASIAYVKRKSQQAEHVGIDSSIIRMPTETSETALLEEIDRLNRDPAVDGILVQLPLPKQIDADKVMRAIDPDKDVDGFHPLNLGRLLMGDLNGTIPCTPLGILKLLSHSDVKVEGQHVVIVGRSNIVGKPLAALLVQKWPGCNATVTIAHSATANLREHCQRADILVAAVGQPSIITADMVKPGAVVIDVGMNRIDDPTTAKGYRLVGDVATEEVAQVASKITPVPGGVGQMTVAMLLENTWNSYLRRK
jgi:methylenetetrahydrofolate dehydrogenase (NADP+)/methenyltetrahydrofolate cyclohydrolase